MLSLAVLILTYNEESRIVNCINSALFAEEIIVVDSGSTDCTCEIAQSVGARVIAKPMDKGFAEQRNFALQQTNAKWVFFLDADEQITHELAVEIQCIVKDDPLYAYEIPLQNIVFGKLLRSNTFLPTYKLRLFPRGHISYHGKVHESVRSSLSKRKAKAKLVHNSYKDWEHFLTKMNWYSTLMAKRMHEEGRKPGFMDIVLKPVAAFLHSYLFKLGFLDGRLGFVMAMFHAYYYTLAKYIKFSYLAKQTERP